MSEQTASTSAAPATSPASAPTSLGWQIDAEIVLLKSRIATLETAAKTDGNKAIAWVKTNALHIALTWPAAVTVLKPVVVDLLKFL